MTIYASRLHLGASRVRELTSVLCDLLRDCQEGICKDCIEGLELCRDCGLGIVIAGLDKDVNDDLCKCICIGGSDGIDL